MQPGQSAPAFLTESPKQSEQMLKSHSHGSMSWPRSLLMTLPSQPLTVQEEPLEPAICGWLASDSMTLSMRCTRVTLLKPPVKRELASTRAEMAGSSPHHLWMPSA